MRMRFHLPPGGDVPPLVAARRLGLELDAFQKALPLLIGRGFPKPDETTGNFDIDAIDAWRKRRHPQLFGQPSLTAALDARSVVADRVARMKRGQG
ncbi:MAG TPA: hypothetical protein VKX28_27090 [Xanthobacteraceae bacterium]|nr:hypothetical protein [Xanthobacteraceae bacterium]